MNQYKRTIRGLLLLGLCTVQCAGWTEVRADSLQYAVDYQAILDRKATYEDIIAALRTTNPNHLSNLVGALIRVDDDPRVRTLLNDLWAGNKGAHPRLPWHLIRRPAVRIAVASSLQHTFKPEPSPYLAYIRGQLRANDPYVVRAAARHIGLRGDDSDVPALVSLAHKGDIWVASTAISGLSARDSRASVTALRELLDSWTLSGEKKEVVRDVLDRLEKRPKRFRRAWAQ